MMVSIRIGISGMPVFKNAAILTIRGLDRKVANQVVGLAAELRLLIARYDVRVAERFVCEIRE